MKKTSKAVYSRLELVAVLLAAGGGTGCISAKSQPQKIAASAVPADAESGAATADSWGVAKGEHLWGISGAEEVFNTPEKWPLLYKANIGQIRDADLIYPGQVLEVPRDSSYAEESAAIAHAKSRGAWAVGPVELSDKAYLKNSP